MRRIQDSNLDGFYTSAVFKTAALPIMLILQYLFYSCGGRRDRTFTAFTRPCLANMCNKPIFTCHPSGRRKTRTFVLLIYSQCPLPRCSSQLYPQMDSNHQHENFKSSVFTISPCGHKKSLSFPKGFFEY